jgi:hypothetical protein
MAAKITLTIIGLVMIVQGIVFYSFSEEITSNMFPHANSEALKVGHVLRQLLAAGSLFIGIILFLARTNVTSAAKRILFGASVGFAIIVITLVVISIFQDDVKVPVYPLIIFSIFSFMSFIYGDSGLRDHR